VENELEIMRYILSVSTTVKFKACSEQPV